jgi:hypothetical protein
LGTLRIEGRCVKREAHRSHTEALRVIGTDALYILLVSPEPSDGEEHKQDTKDNPNINAHQSSPAAGSYPTQGADRVSAPTRNRNRLRVLP